MARSTRLFSGPRKDGFGAAGAVAILALSMIVIAGCAGGSGSASSAATPTAESPSSPSADAPDPSPTPEPEPLGIRDADLGSGTVLFSWGGLGAPESLEFVDGAATSEFGTFAMGEPTYADATGDGHEDALVAIEQSDGQGWQSLWYIFVSDGEGGAVQVPAPIAQASRCGDSVESVGAADSGGFFLDLVLRIPGVDDAVPCSDPGTGRERRVVTVAEVGTSGVLLPVQTEPVVAWGGICPGTEWMDTEPSFVALYALPDDTAPVVNPADAPIGVYPAREEAAPVVASGMDPNEWAFIVFTSEATSQAQLIAPQCAWARRG